MANTTVGGTGLCPHGVVDGVCLHCTPMLLIGDRMRMSVELIRQIQDDWANGNVVTVCVDSIVTRPDGFKVLWLRKVEDSA